MKNRSDFECENNNLNDARDNYDNLWIQHHKINGE